MWLQWYAYTTVKGTVAARRLNNSAYGKKLAIINKALLISYILKINNAFIDSAEDLDVVMPMHNLIEYSKNYSKTLGGLWNYYRDELNSGLSGAGNNINYSIKYLNERCWNYCTIKIFK